MICVSALSGWLRSRRRICRSSSSRASSVSFFSSARLPVVGDLLGQLLALAELLLDGLELLAQEVLALAAVDLAPGLRGDLLLHGEHLDLARQKLAHLAQPLDRIDGFEDGLRFGRA